MKINQNKESIQFINLSIEKNVQASFENKNVWFKDFYENSLNSKKLLNFLKYLDYFSNNKDFIKSFKKRLVDDAQGISLYSLVSQDFIQREQRKQYQKEFILKDIYVLPSQIGEKNIININNSELIQENLGDSNKINDGWKNDISLLVQSTFSHILLDIYMPTQDELLSLLGKELNYNSLGQDLLGSILQDISSFASSNVNYNLSSYISQTMGTNNFSTTFSSAEIKLKKELLQAGDDIKVTNKVISFLKEQLNQIQLNTELTADQISKMTTLFSDYISNLEASKQNLLNLMNLLNSLSIIEKGSNGFAINGPNNWQASLIELEGLVVNGDQNNQTKDSGLLNFFNNCMNQQLEYGDLAQSQQLTLQLELAAIQQEWTIISSALRILNKIFMNLASEIKR